MTGPKTSAHTPPTPGVAVGPIDGVDRRRCSALARRTGERCLKRPIVGGTVCASHGGAAPQVRAAARRRTAEAGAAALVSRSGYAPLDDPVEALLDTAGEMIALKDALAEQVARLTDVTVTDRTGAENVVAVLAAYERALERVGKLLVAMNRLDIQARRVDIEEVRLRLLADAVLRAVWSNEANLDHDTGRRVLGAISREFAALPVAG